MEIFPLEDHDYPLSLPEDIFAKLNDSTTYNHINLSNAFLQINNKTATLFQEVIDKLIAPISNVVCYTDGIFIFGETKKKHDEALIALMNRIQEFGAFSKWPEIIRSTIASANTTLKILSLTFGRFGLSKIVTSDNGTHCTAKKVQKFNFLINYRTTPAEIIFGRKLRTTILKQPFPESFGRNTKLENYFKKKHGAIQRNFNVKDQVWVKIHRNNTWSWKEGGISRSN